MGLFGPPNVGKMKAKRDVKGLIKALSYQKKDDVREEAAYALGELKDVRAVAPLIAAFNNAYEKFSVRLATAEALGHIGDVRAVDPLIATLKDREWSMREAAAAALVSLYRQGGLDLQTKAKILAYRSQMVESHHDVSCFGREVHGDSGIGVAF